MRARAADGRAESRRAESVLAAGRPSISGYVLKLIRESVPLSQERLAELFGVERNTVQSWESGRRPLISTQVTTLLRLQSRLRALGANPLLVDCLVPATEAEQLLADLLSEDGPEVADHPLSAWVLRRSTYEFVDWAVRGRTPAALTPPGVQFRRRPVASPRSS